MMSSHLNNIARPMTPLALKVSGLGKQYQVYKNPRERLKSILLGKSPDRIHHALKGINFSLGKGQCLGVVGDNGAGKSTLLKLLTGTLQPTIGSIEKFGRLTAILELGAGFHPDFTGRENLYFAGSLIGIDTNLMKSLESEIIEFSELNEAIDRPVKTYSSGMTVRLAFALVTAVESDILIIDEALAVGDQNFQKKCVDRIDAFRKNGCTILFCSHSLYHIRHLCDVSIWIDAGEMKHFGSTEEVLASYESHVRAQQQEARSQNLMAESEVEPVGSLTSTEPDGFSVDKIESVIVPNLGKGDPPLLAGDQLSIQIHVRARQQPSIGIMLEQYRGVGITSLATHSEGVKPRQIAEGKWTIGICFPKFPMHSGQYVISVYLFSEDGLVILDEWRHCQIFQWIFPSVTPGLVRLPHAWT